MASLYRAFIAFAQGNKDESRSPLLRAQSILKEAKMDAGPDDRFEINFLHGCLEEN